MAIDFIEYNDSEDNVDTYFIATEVFIVAPLATNSLVELILVPVLDLVMYVSTNKSTSL